MSEKTDARHIARRLGWDYTRSLYFVRDNVALALEMRGEGDTDTVREALTELAEAANE